MNKLTQSGKQDRALPGTSAQPNAKTYSLPHIYYPHISRCQMRIGFLREVHRRACCNHLLLTVLYGQTNTAIHYHNRYPWLDLCCLSDVKPVEQITISKPHDYYCVLRSMSKSHSFSLSVFPHSLLVLPIHSGPIGLYSS